MRVKDAPCLNNCPYFTNCFQYFVQRKKVNHSKGLWTKDRISKHDTEPSEVKHIPVSEYLKEKRKLKKLADFVSKQIELQSPKTY